MMKDPTEIGIALTCACVIRQGQQIPDFEIHVSPQSEKNVRG